MKNIRFTEMVEHRFVHDAAEPPVPLNDIARALARPIGSNPIADTDLVGTVWKVPAGAEMSVPNKDADKLMALGYAELPVVAAVGDAVSAVAGAVLSGPVSPAV